MAWEVQLNGGSWVSPASLGWSGVRLKINNLGQSFLTVRNVCPDATVDAQVAYGGTVALRYDNVIRFSGRRIHAPRRLAPRREQLEYVFADAWWYLDNCTYQQEWKVLSGGALAYVKKARLLLGADKYGVKMNTGEVIADVLQYAIDRGAPFEIGSIDPAADAPVEELNGAVCSEIIKKLLRYTPDCVSFFDYSSGTPVLHIRKRANLDAATAALAKPVDGLDICPREDLRVPCVVLQFERAHSDDGQTYETVVIDKWPETATGDEFGALIIPVNLQGGNTTYLKQEVHVETMHYQDADMSNKQLKAWWREHVKKLQDPRLSYNGVRGDFFIRDIWHDGATVPYPKELKSGSIAPWMDGVYAEERTFYAKVSYAIDGLDENNKPDASGKHGKIYVNDDVVSCTVMTTNADDKTYMEVQSADGGEPTPVGLARAIYESLSELQYDGSVSSHEVEVTGWAGVGKVLNVTGGRAEWAAMRALIQRAEFDLDTGRSNYVFGPAKHIGADDMVELFRMQRQRRIIFATARETGQGAAVGVGATLAKEFPRRSESGGQAVPKEIILYDPNTGDTMSLSPAGGIVWKNASGQEVGRVTRDIISQRDADGVERTRIEPGRVKGSKAGQGVFDINADDVPDAKTATFRPQPVCAAAGEGTVAVALSTEDYIPAS